MNISAVVMASGLSKRMNQNKLQMKFNNKKIYEYILDTIISVSCFKEVVVVAKDTEILEKATSLAFKAVKNEYYHLGQSASMKLGIKNVAESDGYMFFVADQPFLTEKTIKKLCEIFCENPNKIIVPNYNEVNKNPVIFPKCLKEELLSVQGDIGGRSLIKNKQEYVLRVPINNENEFFDIDTFEDYENLSKMKVFK